VSSGADSSGKFQWKAAAILFGILFLGVTDTALIPPLLPSIAEDLHTSPGRAGTVVTVYALAAAAFALVLGMASDRIGRKRLMCLALVVFATASLITYQSFYFSTLLAARLLTGLSAGTLSTLAFSFAGDHYPYQQRGKAMGIISMAYFLVFVISIPAGTFVAARFGWRWVFLGLAVAGAFMALVALLLLPPDKRQPGPASTSSVLAHFRSKDRVAGMGVAFLTSGALVGFLTYVGVWLASEGIGIERIGLLFMVAGVAATAAAPVSGWLADRVGKRVMILAANVVLAPLFIVVSNVGWGLLLFLTVGVLSVTAAARQAPLHALTTELVGSEVRGSYIAVRNAASQLGIAFAATVSATAFDQSGFSSVAWIAAIMTLLILPTCRWLKEPVKS
jgi:predicted MFS family arabinose efflux permease